MSNNPFSGKTGQSNVMELWTGPSNFKLLDINPDLESIQKWIPAIQTEPNYDLHPHPYMKVKDGDTEVAVESRRINFLVQSRQTKKPYLFNIDIAENHVESKSNPGNKMIINDRIQSTWGYDAEQKVKEMSEARAKEGKQPWFSDKGARFCRIGERQFYYIIDSFVKHSHAEDTNFIEDLKKINLSFDDFLKGKTGDVKQIIDFLNNGEQASKYHNLMLFSVKMSGTTPRQVIELGNDNSIDKYVYRRYQEADGAFEARLLEVYRNDPYFTKNLMTTKLQKFNPDDCFNYVSLNTETSTENEDTIEDDALNF